MLRDLPQSSEPISDVHRFWEQTGTFYARGMGNDNLADPFIALGTMPATTALFRDMTGIRFEHPEWIAENCTACGNCYTVCPDTAIPGLVSEVDVLGAALDTVLKRDVSCAPAEGGPQPRGARSRALRNGRRRESDATVRGCPREHASNGHRERPRERRAQGALRASSTCSRRPSTASSSP
jgi:Fe-S-cluster-containing hydrogenase component 2